MHLFLGIFIFSADAQSIRKSRVILAHGPTRDSRHLLRLIFRRSSSYLLFFCGNNCTSVLINMFFVLIILLLFPIIQRKSS